VGHATGLAEVSNILKIPLVQAVCETGANEDWLDGFAYFEDIAETIPISLVGISFEMEMRTVAADPTVVLHATTFDGSLSVASYPPPTDVPGGIQVTQNCLQLNVPVTAMMHVPPGTYAFDIVAKADGRTRVVVQGTAAVILQGYTR